MRRFAVIASIEKDAWVRQAGILLFVAGGIVLIASGLATFGTDVAVKRFFDNVHWTTAYATAAALAWLGVRNAIDRDVARAKRWFAWALTAYAGGQMLWDVQVATDWNPFPGPSDVLFLCLGLFFAIGLATHLRRETTAAQFRAAMLDIAGLTVAVLALTLALYLPRSGQTELPALIFLVAYPVVLAGAACIAVIATLVLQHALTAGAALFMLALLANGALWLEWNARTLDASLVDGGLYNAMFSVVALAQGAGVCWWQMRRTGTERWRNACDRILRVLPTVIVIVSATAVVITYALSGISPLVRGIALGGGLIVVVLAMLRQSVLLTERERMMQLERSLRAQEAAYRVLVEQSVDGIFIADRLGRYLDVNPAGARMLGMSREEVLTLRMLDIVPDDERHKVPAEVQSLLRGDEVHSDWRLKRKDGSTFDAEISAKMLPDGRLQGTVRDVSERRALEEQLRQAQKMEAIGTLAAGIAHDFNNLLMAIRGYTEILSEDVGARHGAQASLQEIRKATSRAGQLVNQILAFSRPTKPSIKIIRPAEVVDEVARLLRSTLPAGVEISVHADDDVPNVSADPAQLHQLLLNLGTNAWQAMEGHGGHLDFVLGSETVGASSALNVSPGLYASLRVTDTGEGMDEATCARIFEPFFTTKRNRGGTGLGLAVVHGIVRNHGGAITVRSAPGVGTTFTIFLPAARAAVASEQVAATAAGAVDGRGLRVLYVDDEQSLVALMTEQLERNRFRARGVTSAHVALSAIRSDVHAYDIVVCDFNMPKMSGIELIREIKSLRRDLPCVLISGFVDENLQATASAAGIERIAQKPLSPAELCDLIAALISEPGRSTLDAPSSRH